MPSLNELRSTAFVFAVLTVAYFGLAKATAKKKLPLPPAPAQPRFILGHMHIIPTEDQHVVYRDWAKHLGSDVIALKVPGFALVVINSAQAAYNIFNKKARKYSGRPYIPVAMDPTLLDWSGHIGILPYGERWKHQRQLMQPSLNKSGVDKLGPIQIRSARKMASRMLDRSDHDFAAEFLYMFGDQILLCVYGYEVNSPDDRFLKLVEGASAHLGEALLPNNFLVNMIPWLSYVPSWVPGAGWKKVVKQWGQELRETIELPYQFTVDQLACRSELAAGTALPSILSEMLANAQTHPDQLTPEDKDRIMWTAGTLYTAATDSLVATMQVFMLAMTLHREVQVKIQEEFDRVTGGKRLPEPSDEVNMPYLRCVILEVLRWQSVTPLGIPHLCEAEDVYEGYSIPKGALVFGNIWAINRDDSVYHKPDSFIPERFLDPIMPEPANFGFGRRKCPGMHFAHASLFVTISTLMATFDIKPVQDNDGRDIIPKAEMVQGPLAFTPAPFRCMVTPRSERHKQLLVEWSAY